MLILSVKFSPTWKPRRLNTIDTFTTMHCSMASSKYHNTINQVTCLDWKIYFVPCQHSTNSIVTVFFIGCCFWCLKNFKKYIPEMFQEKYWKISLFCKTYHSEVPKNRPCILHVANLHYIMKPGPIKDSWWSKAPTFSCPRALLFMTFWKLRNALEIENWCRHFTLQLPPLLILIHFFTSYDIHNKCFFEYQKCKIFCIKVKIFTCFSFKSQEKTLKQVQYSHF